MADVNGGALSFTSIMDNDQMNAAIEETLRRVQGFSDAVVGSGDTMDKLWFGDERGYNATELWRIGIENSCGLVMKEDITQLLS